MLLGLRGQTSSSFWDVNGSMDLGGGLTQNAGRWGSADATATRRFSGRAIGTRLNTTLNALQYTSPFSYGAYSASLWPSFSLNATPFTVTLTPQATGGFWSASGETGSIGVLGSSLALSHDFGSVTAQLSAEAQHATNGALNGTFKGSALDLSTSVDAFDLGGGVKVWRTPTGNEWGYNVYAVRTAGSIAITAMLARSTTDPVLATPGSFGASLGVSWRIANRNVHADVVKHAAERGVVVANGRRVHFSVQLPDAKSVSLSGSFTDWKPVNMTRVGNEYVLDMVVPAGTHQYGFLVNGTDWYVPPTASGIVDDGFGRKHATLVIARQ